MEVFLRNVPIDLSDRGLERELKRWVEKLGITDYMCEKIKNKPLGHITFLREQDGHRFLSQHGEEVIPQTYQPRSRHWKFPPTKARLSLRNQDVFCKLSNRNPTEISLKVIQNEVAERRKRIQASQTSQASEVSEKPVESVRSLEATELSCGFHTYIGDRFTFVAEWSTIAGFVVRFGKRFLVFSWNQSRGPRMEVRISYQSIISLVWSENGSASVTLAWAPTVFSQDTGSDLAAVFELFGFSDLHWPDRTPNRMRFESIDSDHKPVSPFCLVYHFKIPTEITGHASSNFHHEMWKLRKKELFHVIRYDIGFQHSGAIPRFGRFTDALASLKEKLGQYQRSNILPFGLLFLLQALVYNGYLHPATVSEIATQLVQLFEKAGPADARPPISIDAFRKLFEWIEYPMPHSDPHLFEAGAIMQYLMEQEQLVREGYAARSELFKETENIARIFRIVVSPFRITLHGPDLETKNRVLRRYGDHTDFFLRAQFCDETGQDLFFSPGVSLDKIYSRFKSVLANGIEIAGRVYEFLGFSHSSLRAHSVWFSAAFVYQGMLQYARTIIEKLGKFKDIKSAARRAARIGQAFSETPYSISLDEHQISVADIPDVERCDRIFSDGVGKISLSAVNAVYKVIPESKGSPTCFQIRWAGAKGMLSLDTTLPGNVICVRKSMTKFKSSENVNLEICDMASKPIPMMLNRQLIKILEDMGAPDWWFLGLQDKEIRRLRAISATVRNTASFLKINGICESIRLSVFLHQVEIMGVDYRRDKFLRNAIEVILLKELRLLKHKARVPVREGITLFGVLDETGFLEEEQVYVTFDVNRERHGDPPGAGRVIVTRSPALHPGDVQTAENTIPSEGHPLRALRNCIVFSQKGDRDLPSQLSGGDLDGDIYNVIWDEAVVSKVQTFKPANYPRTNPVESDMTVEDFFVEFMKADKLPMIATRHMILADQRESGTNDKDAIKLAELHSNAVDFSKTGQPVELSQLPKAGQKWRPDFLAPGPHITIHNKSEIDMEQDVAEDDNKDEEANDEGPKHRYYKSNKILGQLYRAIDEHRIWNEDIKMTVEMGGPSFWDELLRALHLRVSAIGTVYWRRRTEEAQRIRHAYEDAVFSTMVGCSDHPNQPLRELEVFVGFIINKSGSQSRRQRDKSIKLKDEFERITNWMIKDMRNPSSVDSQAGELDALELCLACVHIGCVKEFREEHTWHRSSTQDLQSFRIVAASALIRELNMLESETTGAYSGGYVGTRNGPGTYSSVPPPGRYPMTETATSSNPTARCAEPLHPIMTQARGTQEGKGAVPSAQRGANGSDIASVPRFVPKLIPLSVSVPPSGKQGVPSPHLSGALSGTYPQLF